ncbi:hypothetical protein [Flagellimonas flava]|uniref:hypothetical protein n=1 Tax=Flagellimonas flava TaxID=570519 RepID=UPI003D64BC1A
MKFWVVPSENEPNTHFIFRDTGTEVKVVIKNNILLPDHHLFESEKEYFKKNILQCGHLEINMNKTA